MLHRIKLLPLFLLIPLMTIAPSYGDITNCEISEYTYPNHPLCSQTLADQLIKRLENYKDHHSNKIKNFKITCNQITGRTILQIDSLPSSHRLLITEKNQKDVSVIQCQAKGCHCKTCQGPWVNPCWDGDSSKKSIDGLYRYTCAEKQSFHLLTHGTKFLADRYIINNTARNVNVVGQIGQSIDTLFPTLPLTRLIQCCQNPKCAQELEAAFGSNKPKPQMKGRQTEKTTR